MPKRFLSLLKQNDVKKLKSKEKTKEVDIRKVQNAVLELTKIIESDCKDTKMFFSNTKFGCTNEKHLEDEEVYSHESEDSDTDNEYPEFIPIDYCSPLMKLEPQNEK